MFLLLSVMNVNQTTKHFCSFNTDFIYTVCYFTFDYSISILLDVPEKYKALFISFVLCSQSKQHRYIANNSFYVKIIHFSVMTKIIRY